MFASNNIEFVSEQKAFGNEAEDYFSSRITTALPDCIIKSNVIVLSSTGACEIDNIIQYKNKLFIVEIKNWKGEIEQNSSEFITRKRDKYTNEIHTNTLKSPFGQVKRQINLLKQLTNSNPWINPIIYFNNAECVIADRTVEWFTDIDSVVDYIVNDGKSTSYHEITKCINNCREADFVYSPSIFGERSCRCLIDDLSIKRICNGLEAKSIYKISIHHHFSYDDVNIYLRSGQMIHTTVDNETLIITDTTGKHNHYNLCKIETIIIGKR